MPFILTGLLSCASTAPIEGLGLELTNCDQSHGSTIKKNETHRKRENPPCLCSSSQGKKAQKEFDFNQELSYIVLWKRLKN
tara:strand:- start:637 stop:879 length:243 start_codon:yes stop_codon:yes gene_type:complete